MQLINLLYIYLLIYLCLFCLFFLNFDGGDSLLQGQKKMEKISIFFFFSLKLQF